MSKRNIRICWFELFELFSYSIISLNHHHFITCINVNKKKVKKYYIIYNYFSGFKYMQNKTNLGTLSLFIDAESIYQSPAPEKYNNR